jgi:hypothetical protein
MRGRFVPLGSFSSDELSIVWEFMGGNGFFGKDGDFDAENWNFNAYEAATKNRI